jgi:pre-rRNA-processing protein TSR3
MQSFPPTYVLRHRRENLKKCSLRGLEGRADFRFYTYPTSVLPDTKGYVLLALDAPPLSEKDNESGLFLIDATWRYAEKMLAFVDRTGSIEKRSIPAGFVTAYPRRQDDCPFPDQGLASIEALYIAYKILGRDADSLLSNYYWKDEFLSKNEHLFS